MKPLVIIHGWSDEAGSFTRLASEIGERSRRSVEPIWLGDYVSLDDNVRMADLVRALENAWSEQGLSAQPRAADVIVHSTGGLIIRDWMYSLYASRDRKPPVNNLVMLAPANFGSPLAHKGRAFYGRAVKGFQARKRFHTGSHILKALEMASPYSRALAFNDRFGKRVLSPTGVRTTVITGNTGNAGIGAIANEDGSDGTVYVASANLNCARLELDFARSPRSPRIKHRRSSRGETAFLVIDDHNHGSIAFKDPEHQRNDELMDAILRGLAVSNQDQFRAWIDECEQRTKSVLEKHQDDDDPYRHGYQNTVVRVVDDQGNEVSDYVVEFYENAEKGWRDHLASFFNKKVVRKVHSYRDNAAYRSFMIDCSRLYNEIDQHGEHLRISLSAMPDLDDERNMAGYRTFEDDDIGHVELGPEAIRGFFRPNRTLFVDIVLRREQKEALFTLDPLRQF